MEIKINFTCKVALILFAVLCLPGNTSAQAPQKMSYQAVIRNGAEQLVANHSVGIRITILQGSTSGATVYMETQTPTTNSNGLASLEIGGGVGFDTISWTHGPYYIKTETDPTGGSSYTISGTSQILSVPYALSAGSLSGKVKKLAVKGETSNDEEALFEVKNKDGQTIFAVYNSGVRIYVKDGSKGTKGGFAIGGFSSLKGGVSQNLLVVDSDSIRAYVDTNTGKGTKGGFAIGGFGTAKGTGEEYLRVTRDSTRIYLNNTLTKGTKGGFAIGGFSIAKGVPDDYMLIKPESAMIYVRSLGGTTSSSFNVISIDQFNSQKSLFKADPDTVDIAGILNVQKNVIVQGNIDIAGTVIKDSSKISDIEGNVYKTVRIGPRLWMTENLKSTKYNDGTPIPKVSDPGEWATALNGSYCDYNNNPANSAVYGKLYNWYAGSFTNPNNVCPTGWHVPSDAEWTAMFDYLIASNYNFDGTIVGNNIAKSLAASTNWTLAGLAGAPGNTDYPEYRNKSEFTALPGGARNFPGEFMDLGMKANWWSSSQYIANAAWFASIAFNNPAAMKPFYNKNSGFSIRCLSDKDFALVAK